jgi:hypothetical protein
MNTYVEFVQEEREWNRFVVEAIAIEEIEEDWGRNKIHSSILYSKLCVSSFSISVAFLLSCAFSFVS